MRYNVNWTPELKDKALDLVTNYLSKYGCGESIMQFDNAIIEAPEVLAEIADFKDLLEFVEVEED